MARSLVHFGGDGLVDEEFASPKISVTRLEKLETGSEPPFQSRKRSVPFPILSTEKLLRYARSRSRGQVWTLEGFY